MPELAAEKASGSPAPSTVLEQGAYEVIRSRLAAHAADLQERLGRLNQARQEVFGAIRTVLLSTDRVATKNKCIPRDMVAIGRNRFVFGYNVQVGLRSQTVLSDVFAVYEYRDHQFHELPLEVLAVPEFEAHFKGLYQYFKQTTFSKFSWIGPHLFMVFQVGKNPEDIKTFKWLLQDEKLVYLGNRSDHEFGFPPQHEFEWMRTHRELHRFGLHPHISIEDRVFVETIGGDLTIKVEDNTTSGQGIYSEPVENKDQTLDDAEVYYASLGNLILLKIRPYQEKRFRYLVHNEKLQQVRRIDSIEDACVLLPDGHGIIFSNGYYLQSGEHKTFETALSGIKFDGRLQSPNGEDYLYRFYHPPSGNYILLSYNVIEQRVELPMVCGGHSLFENGEMAIFKDGAEPQKHHVIQIWQTPYTAATHTLAVKKDSFLYKIGNPDLVSAMAECREVLNLLGKEDTYADLYLDILKKTGDILDSYFWIGNEETFNLKAALQEIRAAASSALEEFDKVIRIRRDTAERVRLVTEKARGVIRDIAYDRLNEIGLFVRNLAQLRAIRGELISLKELRYVELPPVEAVEQEVVANVDRLSQLAVQFLLTDGALEPYWKRVRELQTCIQGIAKVSDGKRLEEDTTALAGELEMLTEVVSNLKIEDATQTTKIIESISAIYALLNQTRAALKQKCKELRSVEATAEFASQSRLLNQALANYLDLSQTPAKCEEYLTKLMVQVEELEARFADFDEFVLQLTERRTELYNVFESRKLELVEAQNRKTSALLASAERILKGIKHRAGTLKTVDEINGFFASDMLIEKVRDLIRQLTSLGDSVKADDLLSRLKTIREDAVRQLKDRQELYVSGENLIQLGNHKFSVNTQELELTMVFREQEMWLHLAGTRFFQKVEDEEFLATREVWSQEVISENTMVYRGEFLAYKAFRHLEEQGRLEVAAKWSETERVAFVQEFMSPRYAEAYTKGVQDHDAARILGALLEMHLHLGLLRYPTQARACAAAFWHQFPEGREKDMFLGKLRSYGTMQQFFAYPRPQLAYVQELQDLIKDFVTATSLFDVQW
ncbi:MAG TPA: DNA repair ATPase, partial [Clostridia bacterium]|nr:DNA repair ATPase [Clostridia bacterium]